MRPIDAHIAVEYIKNSDLPNHWKNALISCLLSIPTIAPPPNDPLTPEELLEMCGEPVWIAPVKGKVRRRAGGGG